MTIFVAPVSSGRKTTITLLNSATTTITSNVGALDNEPCTIQASIAGTGAVSASIDIEFSNDLVGWMSAGITPNPAITLSGTTEATDGFNVAARWLYVRAKITAISGTGAAVTVTVGE